MNLTFLSRMCVVYKALSIMNITAYNADMIRNKQDDAMR